MAQLPPMDLDGALLFEVTGQQLSVLATRRILARIEALFDRRLRAGRAPPDRPVRDVAAGRGAVDHIA